MNLADADVSGHVYFNLACILAANPEGDAALCDNPLMRACTALQIGAKGLGLRARRAHKEPTLFAQLCFSGSKSLQIPLFPCFRPLPYPRILG